MRHLKAPILVGFCLMAGCSAMGLSATGAFALKDQMRLVADARSDKEAAGVPSTSLSSPGPRERGKGDFLGDDDNEPDAAGSIDDQALVVGTELSLDAARRALDAYAAMRAKYSDEGLTGDQTLEQYANSSAAGRSFAADIAAFGFRNISEWSRIIASIGFALDAVVDNTEPQLRAEIVRLNADRSMPARQRSRLIASLRAQIPSENNKVIVRQLILDPLYRDKLALLAVYE